MLREVVQVKDPKGTGGKLRYQGGKRSGGRTTLEITNLESYRSQQHGDCSETGTDWLQTTPWKCHPASADGDLLSGLPE